MVRWLTFIVGVPQVLHAMWCVGLLTKRGCALRYWETRYNAFETSLPINEQGSYVAFSTFDACFNTVDPLYGEP